MSLPAARPTVSVTVDMVEVQPPFVTLVLPRVYAWMKGFRDA
jgi:hypothetical protein